MTLSLKRFRMQTFRDKTQDSDSDEPEDIRTESIKQRHKRELERAERENREHTSVLLELRDMDDELTTMKNLFLEQEETIKLMKEQYEKPELVGYTENGRAFLEEALRRLQDYHKTVFDMIQRVDATKKDVSIPYISHAGIDPLTNFRSMRNFRRWCSDKRKLTRRDGRADKQN